MNGLFGLRVSAGVLQGERLASCSAEGGYRKLQGRPGLMAGPNVISWRGFVDILSPKPNASGQQPRLVDPGELQARYVSGEVCRSGGIVRRRGG